MSSFWNFAFAIVLILIWIIAGGYVTQANVFLRKYESTDNNFHRAYRYTFWAAFITWFLVGLFLLLIFLSVIGVVALFGSGVGEAGIAAESAEAEEVSESTENKKIIKKSGSTLTLVFLIFSLILITITGVLAAFSANDIVKSPNFSPNVERLKTSYDNCIIAAVMCLGAGGLLIIGIIVYFVISRHRKNLPVSHSPSTNQKSQSSVSNITNQPPLQQTLNSLQQQQLLQLKIQQLQNQQLQLNQQLQSLHVS